MSIATSLRRWLEFLALALLYLLVRFLPRRWLLPLGRGLGSFVWRVVPIRRRVVLENLRHAFGAELDSTQQREVARRFYRTLGMTLVELLAVPDLSRADILATVRVDGQEHLDIVRDSGRGAIFVSGHFGNFEYLGARMAAEGMPISFVAKAQRNARVDAMQRRIRETLGVGTIGPDATRDMLRALREGQCVAMLADQNAGPEGLLCSFLGRPAWVFRGPAYLAWKFDVPLITGFIYRDEGGRHVVRADAPVFPDRSLSEEEAVRALTEYHVERLEAAIRSAPEHYYWVHRRWKVPEGMAPPAVA
jgi:KDO2-lipid IV(A) lauroyltransferase